MEPTGGNPGGSAYLQSPFFEDPGSTACIEQEVICGSAAGGTGCEWSLDYYLQTFDAAIFSGRLQVYLDDQLLFETPQADVIDWTTLGFSTECGVHTLRLCLDVDPGNNAWIGRFDNVRAECMSPLPVEPTSWGHVKAVYR